MGRLDLRSIVSTALVVILLGGVLAYILRHGYFAGVLLPAFIAFVLLLIFVRMLLDAAPIRTCPNCQTDSLTRRAISPFGYRYYECKSCGIRAKRKPFEDWEDASGASDDRRFRKRRKGSAAVPVDPSGSRYVGPMVGTNGSLLKHKRLRQEPDDQRLISDEPAPRDP